ncbi:uncharacterized protein LOC108808180 [Raphanus sativus]|uniref:Uncharacterized protein LOC108808180 n=1 Tax=Raphanus sativus TaxID=3726 RepID=A0A6J0JJP0_RAPSA|nr:uncharacterized protein LOC108808180 [Raphanus sativus]
MLRTRKRKEPSLMDELKELDLLGEGEMVDIPDLEFEDLIEENTLSVIVRCLNPYVHKVGGLVKALPPIWGLEDRVRGRGVGADRVQFIFEAERDLQHVLTKGPWFVNGWIVSVDRWTPQPAPEFLKRIPFWIRIKGLPIHLLKREFVETLMGPLGKVEDVELHAKNSNSIEYVRALVWINTEEPLQFRRVARFKSGATLPTELEYEKLLKVCFTCKILTHDQTRCPQQISIEKEGGEGRQSHSQGEQSRDPKGADMAPQKEVSKGRKQKGVEIRETQTVLGARGGREATRTSSRGARGKERVLWKHHN